MTVTILDYGAGNLHSLQKALERSGARVRITSDSAAALSGDALLLPGVGAFRPAAEALAPAAEPLRAALDEGLPCLGICLGMQLLFATSEEGAGAGLGVIRGRIRRLGAPRLPHMGWNTVAAVPTSARPPDPILDGLRVEEGPGLLAYYANSFVAEPEEEPDVLAWTEYAGERFPAIVRKGRCWGVQFHPEKSGAAGLRLIRNFLEAARR